ncbi:hypothetical protein [Paractinoplanes hotanensis]|uniref:Uncharacterized protein n=1 Tax=Paractinoplanes hotanensis TaxID=2906497 RepID=A0ABT0YB44_9ACTN|nr:hypothetical protein [Actinoplanes hotanensis]MCM4083025.1 hypothetical protein [Actinoplanes hotanensis]
MWDSDMPLRNRRLLAERLRWPDGALDECLRIEKDRPGFDVCWFREWTVVGFERAEGFHAWRAGQDPLQRGLIRHEWHGVTAESSWRALP